MENPCINCVTYAICKAELLAKLSEFSVRNIMDLSVIDRVYISYHLTLKKKCSLIKDYISNQSNYQSDNNLVSNYNNVSECNHDITQTVFQSIHEAFNIQKT